MQNRGQSGFPYLTPPVKGDPTAQHIETQTNPPAITVDACDATTFTPGSPILSRVSNGPDTLWFRPAGDCSAYYSTVSIHTPNGAI